MRAVFRNICRPLMLIQTWVPAIFMIFAIESSAGAIVQPHPIQTLDVSLGESQWTMVSYSNIPPNKVSFDNDMISLSVVGSSSPLVYRLQELTSINGFQIQGAFDHQKNLEKSKFDEDSIFRFGLVVKGDQTLSGIKRFFASSWVKTLFSLAPKNMGLDKIYFFNVSNRPELLNVSRIHPKSELMLEKVVHIQTVPGEFTLDYKLDTPLSVMALWMSADGDDSNSTFTTTVKKISLNKN